MEKKQPTPRFDREKLATVNCFLRLIDKNPVPVARPPSRLRPDAADAGRPSVEASAAAAAVLASGSANGNDDVSSKQIDRRPTLSRGDLAMSARRTGLDTRHPRRDLHKHRASQRELARFSPNSPPNSPKPPPFKTVVWYGMVNADLYSAIITKVSNALNKWWCK